MPIVAASGKAVCVTWRPFMRALRGRIDFVDVQGGAGSEALWLDAGAAASIDSAARLHVFRAFLGAMHADDDAVVLHAGRARPLLAHLASPHIHAIGLAMAALAASIELAALSHSAADAASRRDTLLADMADAQRWLSERADADPRRYSPFHHYLVALQCAARLPLEPAQLEPALRAFDLAARTADTARRRLRAAFLLEQAARFHLSQGLEVSGHDLMGAAFERYARFGMAAKVEQLQARWPQLKVGSRRRVDPPGDPRAASGADRLAISNALQALTGVTDLDRLVKRIVTVIARISGATDVGLFVRQAFDFDATEPPAMQMPMPTQTPMQPTDPSHWTLVAVARAGQPVMAMRESAAMAGVHGFTPSVVRHALGSAHAETIDDVPNDRRFGHDTEAARNPEGSALLLPIRSRGRPDALLLVKNRLATHFFTSGHVDTLELVAGPLSVALHDALLHRTMAQRMARTARAVRHTVDDVALRDRALEAATEAVSILDATSAEFATVHVNAAFERITGYTRSEVLGRSLYRLYGSDTAQPEIQTLRDAVRHGVDCRVTVRCYRKTGEMFWNEVSVAPVFDADGRASHHVCINRDVTERRRQAAAERLHSERLEAVFALSPDGVVVLDAHDRITSVNPAFESMTGMDDADLLGMAASDLDASLAARADGGRMAPWQSEQPATVRLVRPELRVLLRHTRRGVDGRRATVLYFRDVTRQVEVDRMKSALLATVARELSTPMTTVSRLTELLLDRRLKAALRIEILKVVHHQTAALTSLLDELLYLARTEESTG